MIKILLILRLFTSLFEGELKEVNHNYLDNQIQISINNIESEYNEHQEWLRLHTFNGETDTEIAEKLDRYLNSTLSGKGQFIAEYSISVGMDPYLATAVMLQETGCYWTCSKLVRNCNNVAGNKGKPSCGSGSYRKFDTIEEGIQFAINKLAWYYNNGLTTPERIGPRYAEDPNWATKVNKYINKLKNA